MKKEQISDALNMLNDDILEETDKIRSNGRIGKKRWISLLRWAAAAACLTLAVYAGFRAFSHRTPDAAGDLPMLAISEEYGAMGYEGYLAYDISELVSGNPWTESAELRTLPVYRNRLSYGEDGIVSGTDFDKMRERLLEIAGWLGLDTDTLVIGDDAPDEETKQQIIEKVQNVGGTVPTGYFDPTKLTAEAEGLKIEIDQSMTVTIHFLPAVQLPAGYHFAYGASYEEMLKAAEYLREEYRELIGMEEPEINIYGGDYDINFRQFYHIEFFDAVGETVDRIVNYNFNRTAFYCNDDGMLYMARIYQPDLSQKVGDYPIISANEARALLLSGSYITSVPYEIHGEEYIKKVELVYRTGAREKYYMPYYRFYVEMPEGAYKELRDYGVYYIPAVESAYISNMSTWDGSIN